MGWYDLEKRRSVAARKERMLINDESLEVTLATKQKLRAIDRNCFENANLQTLVTLPIRYHSKFLLI